MWLLQHTAITCIPVGIMTTNPTNNLNRKTDGDVPQPEEPAVPSRSGLRSTAMAISRYGVGAADESRKGSYLRCRAQISRHCAVY
jgi:hypothetical protein